MNVTIHIERLILDGVPVPHRHRPQVQAALEEELARLVAADGLAVDVRVSGNLPRLAGGELQLETEDAELLGKRIAQAVYTRIGNV
ncbi:MAG: hypothetical protein NVSMB27_00300 [Ktedonobacteraceae bacterium]